MSISLGCYEHGLDQKVLDRFVKVLEEQANHLDGKLVCDAGPAKLRPINSADIQDLQTFLVESGFFPDGRIDGICGYRTHAAIRLFQEYVRSRDGKKCLPDGVAGPVTLKHVNRWRQEGLKADWLALMKRWENQDTAGTSFGRWLNMLEKVKKKYQKTPSGDIELVNKFKHKTDTKKPNAWSFSPDGIHLVGVRRKHQSDERRFDDIFILLVRGLVFKFQGSTDPGSSKHKDGAPFLVRGQHDYCFGLHQGKYHALRPLNFQTHGVLVVRSKGDFKLTKKDLKRGVSTNGTINIHWGGKGVGRAVNRWSEGCQVITGSGYEDHRGKVINCSSYVAINNTEVQKTRGKKSRGAYNVLADLLVAFGSTLTQSGELSFTLVQEEDCMDHHEVSKELADSLGAARSFMEKL